MKLIFLALTGFIPVETKDPHKTFHTIKYPHLLHIDFFFFQHHGTKFSFVRMQAVEIHIQLRAMETSQECSGYSVTVALNLPTVV